MFGISGLFKNTKGAKQYEKDKKKVEKKTDKKRGKK